LIAGLEKPGVGTILYGSHPHISVSSVSIRRSVAVAWQQADLLRGSLRSNILFGMESVCENRLREVIEVCQLDALLKSLPDGLDTPVAEWGSTLSSGQQQRLSLARALIRETPVVLLDEISANLDQVTEEILLKRLEVFLAGRTVILVSHRESPVRHADRVVVMNCGNASLLIGEEPTQSGRNARETWPSSHLDRRPSRWTRGVG